MAIKNDFSSLERMKDGKKFTASIQARMGSSRLPGKVMKEIAGKPAIQIAIERARKSVLIDDKNALPRPFDRYLKGRGRAFLSTILSSPQPSPPKTMLLRIFAVNSR